jgi:hypothetical protein
MPRGGSEQIGAARARSQRISLHWVGSLVAQSKAVRHGIAEVNGIREKILKRRTLLLGLPLRNLANVTCAVPTAYSILSDWTSPASAQPNLTRSRSWQAR